jgi:hypothetical protein
MIGVGVDVVAHDTQRNVHAQKIEAYFDLPFSHP